MVVGGTNTPPGWGGVYVDVGIGGQRQLYISTFRRILPPRRAATIGGTGETAGSDVEVAESTAVGAAGIGDVCSHGGGEAGALRRRCCL